MLSISLHEVADYPPEHAAETLAKPCRCNPASAASEQDDVSEDEGLAIAEDEDQIHVDGVIDDQGEEDEHGYKGQKPPKMKDDVNFLDFHGKMTRIREQHDMYVDFLGTAAYCRAPWTYASQVVKAKRKVDELARRLDEQMTLLDSEVANFSNSVSHNVWFDWYDGVVDMTAYTAEDLSNAFGVNWTMEIYNTQHFVTHLRDTLPATIHDARPADEKSCQVYARKLLILLNAIASTRDWNQAMHLAIFLKTKILRRPSSRWTCFDHLSQQNLLSYFVWNSIRQGRAEDHIQFWDFACAWRQLSADWETWDASERVHLCAHKHKGLMMLIYQFATGETRVLCRLALQKQRLPTELVLLITEHTMLASGIPLDRPDL